MFLPGAKEGRPLLRASGFHRPRLRGAVLEGGARGGGDVALPGPCGPRWHILGCPPAVGQTPLIPTLIKTAVSGGLRPQAAGNPGQRAPAAPTHGVHRWPWHMCSLLPAARACLAFLTTGLDPRPMVSPPASAKGNPHPPDPRVPPSTSPRSRE